MSNVTPKDIDDAFAGVSDIPPDTLLPDYHKVPDPASEEWELVSTFRGRSWRTITPDECRLNAVGLAFFTDEAFTYFIPAFLKAALHSSADGSMVESLEYSLDLNIPALGYREIVLQRLRRLSPAQRSVVVGVLREIGDRSFDGGKAAEAAFSIEEEWRSETDLDSN